MAALDDMIWYWRGDHLFYEEFDAIWSITPWLRMRAR
jgi:hypothetical protein